MPQPQPSSNQQGGGAQEGPGKKNPWVQMGDYAQLAFVFPAATVIGWLIGAALDHWLHTTWIYLAGLILGIVAGFVQLFRTAIKDSKNL